MSAFIALNSGFLSLLISIWFGHFSFSPSCLHLCWIGLQFPLYSWLPWYNSLWMYMHFSISRSYLLHSDSLHTIFLQYVFFHFPTGIFFFKCKVIFVYLPCITDVDHFSWWVSVLQVCRSINFVFPFLFQNLWSFFLYSIMYAATHCFYSLLCGRISGVLLDTHWFCRYVGCY